MLFSRWTKNYVKGTNDTGNNLYQSKGIILIEKNPISKGYILHDSAFIKFLKEQNYKDREQMSHCQGLGMAVDTKG